MTKGKEADRRIGIVGLGAVGAAVATRLLASRENGERFGLAAGSQRIAQAIRDNGFALRQGVDELRATPMLARRASFFIDEGTDLLAPSLPHWPDGKPYQLLLLCVRGEATSAALDAALPALAPDGAIVCLQNGLPEERVAARAGQERTLGAVIGWSASSEGPGHAAITGRGGFILGANDSGGLIHLEAARQVLARAFPTRLTWNLAGARWSKLALNCAISTLGAISGLTFSELADRPGARRLALAAIAEVCAVAQLQGVHLSRISGLDPLWLADSGDARFISRLLRPLRHALFWIASRQRPLQRSGMLDRLRAGRSTGQIEDLNGAVAAEAAALGAQVPVNQLLLDTVREMERGARQIDPENISRLEQILEEQLSRGRLDAARGRGQLL